MHFMCSGCGGASIAAPDGCMDEAKVICGSCGDLLGTWRELKERARKIIYSQLTAGESASGVASLDPLPNAT